MAGKITRAEARDAVFAPGQRVRVPLKMVELELASDSGEVVAEDRPVKGMYVVRLDQPARYFPLGVGNGGPSEEVREIRVPAYRLRAVSGQVVPPVEGGTT